MAGNWGAILASLAGGAGSLAQSMDKNEREAARKAELDRAWKRLTDNDKTLAEDRDADRAEKKRNAEQATRDRAMALSEKGLADLTGRYEKAGVKVIDPEVMQMVTGSRLMPQVDVPEGPAGMAAMVSNAAIQGGKGVGVGLQSEALKALAQSTEQKGANVPVSIATGIDPATGKPRMRQIGFASDPNAAKKAEALQAHTWRMEEQAAGRQPRNIDPLSEAGIKAQAKIAAGKSSGVKLPAPAIEKLIDLDAVDTLAANAQSAIINATKSRASVGGRALGVVPIPAWVRNNVTREGGEKGMSARNLLGDLASQIGKLRSGGAITPQEFNRLDQFLPNANDDESTMLIKLKNLRATFADIKRIRIENYQKYGGIGDRNVMTSGGDFGGVVLEPPPED